MKIYWPMLLLAGLLLSESARADSGLQTGEAEVVAAGGGVFGVGSHPSYGAGLAVAVRRRLAIAIDAGYARLGSDAFGEFPEGARFRRSGGREFDLSLMVQYRFPTKESKAVPYLAAGAGFVHSALTVAHDRFGETFLSRGSSGDVAAAAGGGLHLYLTDRFGLRPEAKFLVGEDALVRLSIGIFWQFGEPRSAPAK